MLKTDSETMAVGVGRVGSLVVVDKIVVIKIGDLPAFFLHISLVVIVEVIAAQIHLAVEQRRVTVQTSHPGSRDSIARSPATAAAAHSTAASAHSLHHTSGQIIESTVVGVVAVDHHAELVLIRETSQETGSLVTPVTVSRRKFRARDLLADIVSRSGHNITEEAVHHSFLNGEVDYRLIVAVIDAGELSLLGLLLHDLHLVDDLRGNILGRKLWVVKEECLAVNCYLADCLTVRSDGSILGDLNARKFFQQILQDIVLGRLE